VSRRKQINTPAQVTLNKSRARLLSSVSIVAVLACIPTVARSQTIGPGTVTSTLVLNIPNRTTTVLGNTTIAPTASGSAGINISAGTVVTSPTSGPTPGPIAITINNATGIVVQANAIATLNPNTSITVTANPGTAAVDMSGVRTITGGSATLNGVRVETFGGGTSTSFLANGLFANGSGTSISATNSTLITHGDFAFGANATNGTINLTGGGNSITTSGNSGRGLYAIGTGSITANQLAITTTGANAIAAFALTGGSINLGTQANILTSGDGAFGVQANGATTVLTVGTGGQIKTSGAGAWGASALAGSAVDLTAGGISITTTGAQLGTSGAYAVFATGAGSRIDAGQLNVSTSGTLARGAFADSGGRITLGDGSIISTTGSGANGIAAIGTDGAGNGASVIVGRNLSITTQGSGAIGVQTINGGKVDMTAGGATVNTLLDGASGLFATSGSGVASSITAKDITVVTQGSLADGARADTGSSIALTGTNSISASAANSNGVIALSGGSISIQGNTAITTSGASGAGAVVDGAGSAVSFQGTSSIVTKGDSAPAILVRNGAQVTFDNVSNVLPSLTVQGNQSALLAAQNPGSSLAIGPNITVQNGGNFSGVFGALSRTGSTISFGSGSVLQLSSPDSAALATAVGGNFVLNGATVLAQGSGASYGLLANFGTAAAPNTLTMTGGTLISSQASAIQAAGGILNISAAAGAQISGPQFLNALNGSVVTLSASASSLTGAAFTDAISTSNVTLANNSRWNLTGSSNLTNLVNDPSVIQFSSPIGDPTLLSSYKTLTVVNYIGMGGIIGLNTRLDTDGSPSDRLVINGGAASGNSLLRITNTGGGGAVTTGNGILVVDTINGGTTATGAFALAGEVAAGPYEYRLFRSSVDASNDQAWYLRSTINCTLSPSDPECQGPSPPPPGPVPDFRPETSFYAAIPSLALLYGRNLLDTLHERVGDEEDIRGRTDLHQSTPNTGMWGRIVGTTGQQNNDSAGIFGAGPQYKYDFLGLQAGQDLFRSEHADGSRDHAGVYFAVGGARGHVTHFDGALGTDSFQAYTLGGYWTHFGPTGWYVDTVLQGTYYDVLGGVSQIPGALQISTNGRAVAASVEGGYKFNLPQGYFIEPQAQAVYQNIDLSGAQDAAAQIRFANVDSLAARVGARFGRTWSLDDAQAGGFARTITAWLRPNLWHEFRGDPLTQFSSDTGFIPFRSDLGGSWGELNAGINGQIDRYTTLFANASYQQRFEGKTYAYDGKLGIRVNW